MVWMFGGLAELSMAGVRTREASVERRPTPPPLEAVFEDERGSKEESLGARCTEAVLDGEHAAIPVCLCDAPAPFGRRFNSCGVRRVLPRAHTVYLPPHGPQPPLRDCSYQQHLSVSFQFQRCSGSLQHRESFHPSLRMKRRMSMLPVQEPAVASLAGSNCNPLWPFAIRRFTFESFRLAGENHSH